MADRYGCESVGWVSGIGVRMKDLTGLGLSGEPVVVDVATSAVAPPDACQVHLQFNYVTTNMGGNSMRASAVGGELHKEGMRASFRDLRGFDTDASIATEASDGGLPSPRRGAMPLAELVDAEDAARDKAQR